MEATGTPRQSVGFPGASPGDIPCATEAQVMAFRTHVLTVTALNHIIEMVIYPTQERYDDVVDLKHRDDEFEDASKEVD